MPSPDDDRRAIYEQDMESVRYRDGQKWNRFKTASVVEGTALYASFEAGLSRTESILLMVVATIMLVFVFTLAIMDDRIMAPYLARIRQFESAAGLPYGPAKLRPFLGMRTSRLVMGAILIFNVGVVVRLAAWPEGL